MFLKKYVKVLFCILTSLIVLSSSVGAFNFVKAENPQTVKIGDIAANSGELASVQAISNIAIADINEYMIRNNLPWRFEAVIKNAEGNTTKHLMRLQELKASGVNLVIGGRWETFLADSIPYINSNGVLMITPALTSQVYNQDDNFFRTYPADPKQAFAQRFMQFQQYTGYSVPTGPTVIQRDDAWADRIYDSLAAEWAKINFIGGRVKYPVSTTDFTTTIESAAGYQPWAIMFIGTTQEAIQILNQAKNNIFLNRTIWFGTNVNANQQSIITQAPQAAVKFHLTCPTPSILPSDQYDSIKTRYLSQAGNNLSFGPAAEYDAFWLYALAVVAAGSSESTAVKQKMVTTSANYVGVSGYCKMDNNGDRMGSDYIFYSYVNEGGTTISRNVGWYNDFTTTLLWEGSTSIKTTLTANVVPNSTTVGSFITVSGALSPPVVNASISGRMMNYDGTYYPLNVYTNPDGTYSINYKILKTGTYVIQTYWHNGIRGGQNFNYTATASSARILTITQPRTSTNITISQTRSTLNINETQKITVKLNPTISSAKLTLTITKPDTTTITQELTANATGYYNYQFNPGTIGTWKAKATYAGDSTYSPSSSSDLTFTVTPPQPKKTGLKIIVKDTTPNIIAGATVSSTTQPTGQTTITGTTGADGSLTFDDVKSGTYTITVSKTGYTTKTETVNAVAETTTEKTVTLETAKSNLKVIVKDANSQAVTGATITSTSQPTGQSALTGTTGADGTVTFNDVKPGSYSITISKTDYTTKTDTANVQTGTTTEKTVTLEKSSTGGGIPFIPAEALLIGLVISIIMQSKKHPKLNF